jgi:hypothetical protein
MTLLFGDPGDMAGLPLLIFLYILKILKQFWWLIFAMVLIALVYAVKTVRNSGKDR